MRPAVLEAFLARDIAAMADMLAPDVVFHSPAADYRGREQVLTVLRALTQVITDVEAKRVVHDADLSVMWFGATVGARDADGLLLTIGAGDTHSSELTLMVRPLDALLAGVEEMKQALGRGSID